MLNHNNFAIAKLASKDDSRFTLRGILVTENKTVVTDGHMLAVVTGTPEDATETQERAALTSFIMPSADALGVAVASKGGYLGLADIPYSKNKECKINTKTNSSMVLNIQPLEGNYPDYERVIPSMDKYTVRVKLDAVLVAAMIAQLNEFMKNKNESKNSFVLSLAPDAVTKEVSGPVILEAENAMGQTFKGLIMPMRMDDKKV